MVNRTISTNSTTFHGNSSCQTTQLYTSRDMKAIKYCRSISSQKKYGTGLTPSLIKLLMLVGITFLRVDWTVWEKSTELRCKARVILVGNWLTSKKIIYRTLLQASNLTKIGSIVWLCKKVIFILCLSDVYKGQKKDRILFWLIWWPKMEK